jgi:hypothetical protein
MPLPPVYRNGVHVRERHAQDSNLAHSHHRNTPVSIRRASWPSLQLAASNAPVPSRVGESSAWRRWPLWVQVARCGYKVNDFVGTSKTGKLWMERSIYFGAGPVHACFPRCHTVIACNLLILFALRRISGIMSSGGDAITGMKHGNIGCSSELLRWIAWKCVIWHTNAR